MSTVQNTSMLVSLHQRMWQAKAADRGLAMQAEHHSEAEAHTMTVIKSLAPKHLLRPIKRIADYGKQQHNKFTLPGIMRGQQLLPTKLFDDYANSQATIRDAFTSAVRDFSDGYPELLKKAPKRFGAAFNKSDYPDVESIKDFFEYEVAFAPVPDTTNWFLDGMAEPDMEKLRNEMENEKQDMLRNATKELANRAREVLENVYDQATKFVPGPGNGARLQDATIKSLKDMAVLVSDMNITGDPIIAKIGKEMQEQFSSLQGPEVRANQSLRDKIASVSGTLIKQMAA